MPAYNIGLGSGPWCFHSKDEQDYWGRLRMGRVFAYSEVAGYPSERRGKMGRAGNKDGPRPHRPHRFSSFCLCLRANTYLILVSAQRPVCFVSLRGGCCLCFTHEAPSMAIVQGGGFGICVLSVVPFLGFHFPRGYLCECAVGARCGVGWVARASCSSPLEVLLGCWCVVQGTANTVLAW